MHGLKGMHLDKDSARPCEKHRWGRLGQWNLGGQEVRLLDVAAKDADIICVQEIARSEPGWGEFESEHFQWITHRSSSQWRGTGIGIASGKFDSVVAKLATSRGLWALVTLVRLHGLGRVVCGTLHAHTGVTNVIYQGAAHEFLRSLPAKWRQYPLICGIDANEVPIWMSNEHGDFEVGHCSANLNALLHDALDLGCSPAAPCLDQLTAPTHFPRDATRSGRQIDFILRRHVRLGEVHIDGERRHCIGSDHAFLFADLFVLRAIPKLKWGNDSRARWVVGELPSRILVDEDDVRQLAAEFTKPRKSCAYQDDQHTRAAFRHARSTNLVSDWKKSHKLRKHARSQWQQARLSRVLQGDWEVFRQIQNEKKRRRGWWGNLLRDKSAAELTKDVQKHFEEKMVDAKMGRWDEELGNLVANVDSGTDFQDFTLLDVRGELQNMKCKSAWDQMASEFTF